ncbi:MAG: MmcQ/YjbR family DNA-binding protein [Rhodothermales bacterium]|nr:MmcQ/YjbR family DNA-binding protein [Rhodothermales bacterium]
MANTSDPTEQIRNQAAAFPAVARGTSCNQSSFKTTKRSFLFIGPGPKGKGFKAMFKLDASMPQAEELATQQPDRFEVGSTGWVTTRFTAEEPLPKELWKKWLQESYELSV